MPSQLARNVAVRYADETCLSLADIVDGEIQEVRECVEMIAHPKFTTDETGAIRYYVTKSDVEFARKVFDRLR